MSGRMGETDSRMPGIAASMGGGATTSRWEGFLTAVLQCRLFVCISSPEVCAVMSICCRFVCTAIQAGQPAR